jgi:hypothetical protein
MAEENTIKEIKEKLEDMLTRQEVEEMVDAINIQINEVKKQNVSLMKAYNNATTKEDLEQVMNEIKAVNDKMFNLLLANQNIVDRLDKKKETDEKRDTKVNELDNKLDGTATQLKGIEDNKADKTDVNSLREKVESLTWPARITVILLVFVLGLVAFLLEQHLFIKP